MFLAHLRTTLGIRGVKAVTLHERMTALRRIAIVTVEKGTPRTEVWRALHGAASFKADCGKICVAVNDDIDPENSDALLWAIAFRMNPATGPAGAALPQPGPRPGARARGGRAGERRNAPHGRDDEGGAAAARAAEAGVHGARAPHLGRAGPAELRPQSPWFGTPVGDWLPQWDEGAKRAAEGRYLENGRISAKLRRKGLKPETRFRPDKASQLKRRR